MKQRVLVLNGQRLVQSSEQGSTWKTNRVDKAGALKPGIYNLHSAVDADKTAAHQGVVLHIDQGSVYQQVGKKCVRHARIEFDIVPAIGSSITVRYGETGRAVAQPAPAQTTGRALSH